MTEEEVWRSRQCYPPERPYGGIALGLLISLAFWVLIGFVIVAIVRGLT